MEHNNNEQIIVEVSEKKKSLKERGKAFVQKHKTKLIIGGTALATAAVAVVVCKLGKGTDQDENEESESYEVEIRPVENVETFEAETVENEEV